MRLLIKQTCDYADEFYTHGFAIYTQQEWDDHLQNVRKRFEENSGKPIEKYFGTNEYIEFHDLGEYVNSFDIKELPDRDAFAIEKHLGKSYGTMLLIE